MTGALSRTTTSSGGGQVLRSRSTRRRGCSPTTWCGATSTRPRSATASAMPWSSTTLSEVHRGRGTHELAPQVKQDHNVIGGGRIGVRADDMIDAAASGLSIPDATTIGSRPEVSASTSVQETGPSRDKACRPRYDARSVANRGAGMPRYVDAGALEYTPKSQPGDTTALHRLLAAFCAERTAGGREAPRRRSGVVRRRAWRSPAPRAGAGQRRR